MIISYFRDRMGHKQPPHPLPFGGPSKSSLGGRINDPSRDLTREAFSGQAPAALRGPAEVRAYWEGLRRDGAIPSRADIDPRGMADVLHSVFVGESIGKGLMLLRIAGSDLSEIAGIEARGLPLSVLFRARSREKLSRTIEKVLAQPMVAEFSLEAETRIGQTPVRAHLLLLPLNSADGARKLVLGCLATTVKTVPASSRFEIMELSEEILLLPAETPLVAEPAAPLPIQLSRVSPRPAFQSKRSRPSHLRLVHSVN